MNGTLRLHMLLLLLCHPQVAPFVPNTPGCHTVHTERPWERRGGWMHRRKIALRPSTAGEASGNALAVRLGPCFPAYPHSGGQLPCAGCLSMAVWPAAMPRTAWLCVVGQRDGTVWPARHPGQQTSSLHCRHAGVGSYSVLHILPDPLPPQSTERTRQRVLADWLRAFF